MSWPTPRVYRITPTHPERNPVLFEAALAGQWQRHARDVTTT